MSVGSTAKFGAEIVLKENATEGLQKISAQAQKTGQEAQGAFGGATAEVSRLEKELATLQQTQKKQSEGFTDIFNKMQAAQQGFQMLSQGINAFAERSSQLQTVGAAFRTIATDAGKSADGILAALRKATRGTIDDLELMKQTNLATFLIGKDIINDLPKLFEIARASAKATGQSIEFLTNSVVTGLGRMSPRILDNLGITVKLEEANEKYAKALGKSSDALTEQEKRQALLNEVLEQGQRQIDAIGGGILTLKNATAGYIENLGIFIDTTAALEKYAIQLGKTADQLTETERRQAFLNEAQVVGKDRLEELAEEQLTIEDRLKAQKVAWTNWADEILKSTGDTSRALAPVIGAIDLLAIGGDKFAPLILSLTAMGPLFKGLALLAAPFAVHIAAVVGALWGLKEISDTLVADDKEYYKKVAEDVEVLSGHLGNLIELGERVIAMAERGKDPVDAFFASAESQQGLKSMLEDLGMLPPAYTEARDRAASFILKAREFKDVEVATESLKLAVHRFAKEAAQEPEKAMETVLARVKEMLAEREKAEKESHKARLKAQKEMEREEKKLLKAREDAIKKHLKDVEFAQKRALKERLRDIKEEARELKDDIKGWFKWADSVKSAWRSFEESRREALPQFQEDLEKMGELLQDATGKKALDTIGEFAEAWGIDLKDAIDLASGAAESFRTKAGAALDEVAAKADGTDQALRKLPQFQPKMLDPFQTMDKRQRGDPIVRRVGGTGHKSFSTRRFQGPGSFQTSELDMGVPAGVQQMIVEFEALQTESSRLALQLEFLPRRFSALRDQVGKTNAEFSQASFFISESAEALADSGKAVLDTSEAMRTAEGRFTVAQENVGDLGRSFGQIGIAGEQAQEGMGLAADAVSLFSAEVGGPGGAVEAVSAFGDELEDVWAPGGSLDGFAGALNAFVKVGGPLDSFEEALFESASDDGAIASFDARLFKLAGLDGGIFAARQSISALKNLVTAFGATLDTERLGSLAAFEAWFEDLEEAARNADTEFILGGSSLRSDILDFALWIQGQAQVGGGSGFDAFRHWFAATLPGATSSTISAISSGVPGAIESLLQTMDEFSDDPRLISFIDAFHAEDGLTQAVVDFGLALEGLLGAEGTGPFGRLALGMQTLSGSTTLVKIGLQEIGGDGQSGGAVHAVGSAFTWLHQAGGPLPQVKDALVNFKTQGLEILAQTGNRQKALPVVEDAVFALGGKLSGGTGTLDDKLRNLVQPGWLGIAGTQFTTWASAMQMGGSEGLAGDVQALADAVGNLRTALDQTISQQASNYGFEMGFPGEDPWRSFGNFFNTSGSGPPSWNNMREPGGLLWEFQGSFSDMAFHLQEFWDAKYGRSAGPSAMPGGDGGGGGGGGGDINVSISVNNPIMTHARAVDDLADRVSRKLALQLRSKSTSGRLSRRL